MSEYYLELDDDGSDYWEDRSIEDEQEDWENVCSCGRPGNDYCGFCGVPLCHMCFECGAGFCSGPHTREQVDDYARSIGAL